MSNKNPKHKKKTSWELQQEKLKAEKEAKLKKLLEQERPVYKKKTVDEKIAEKANEELFSNVKKSDNTRVAQKNNVEIISKVARNKTDKEIGEERQVRMDAQAQANAKPFDWSNFRQSLSDRSQATGDALRVSNEPNFFDDYINPAAMIGSMADNLGQAPLQAQQTDSYMPYVTAVGTPLAVGAMAGIGTQNTGQFVNNLANPLAGTGDLVNNLGNKYLSNAYKLNPLAKKVESFNNLNSFYRQVDDETFKEGLESGLIKGKQNVDKTRGESIINLNKSFGDDAYYKKSSLYSPQRADYIYEVQKGEEAFIPKVNNRTRGYTTENTPIRVSREPIPLTEANIYQKDWLKGYKQLNNSVSNPLIPLYRGVQGQEESKNFAMGGNLKQQTNNNMLNEFNVGNSHENNPLGGIPQGMGQNGQMNSVEEGETRKDNFIYSNRITLTPEVVAQFNLPKSLSGKTAADATKLINNKFEGRNSKIDNSTKKAFLDRIAEAQETVKAEEQAKIQQALQTNSTEVPDMMEGQIPQGMEEYVQPQEQPMAYGGNLQNKMYGGGMMNMFGSMAGSMGNSMNTYGQQMNQSKLPEGYVDEKAMSDAQGNQMIDSTKDTIASATGPFGQLFRGIQKAGQGIGNSIGGEGGAAVSGIFSPEEGTMSAMKDKDLSIGQKALATIPGVGGVIAKRQADKRLNKWRFEKDTFEANSKISNFALGGNMYGGGGDFDKSSASYDPTKISLGLPQQKQTIPLLDNLEYVKSLQKTKDWYDKNPPIMTTARTFGPQGGHSNYAKRQPNVTDEESFMSKASKYAKDNYGNALRYAPVAMNAYQLSKMGKPEIETLDRLRNKYNPQYMDEKALTNQINAETNYTANALANASNGSLGSLSNNILGMQLNKTKALSDAYSKIADVNRNEDKTGQQFNLGVDQFNVGQSNQEKDINARNRGAFNTERSKLLGRIGDDLGNIGKEEVYKKIAKETFGYTWDGKYFVNAKGNKITAAEMQKQIDETHSTKETKTDTENTKAFGGFMNNTKFKRY